MNSFRDYIIKNISQVKIFSKYLDIHESDILDSIDFKTKISNPFREDENPSLCFKDNGTKIISKDYGDSNYSGDVFEVVGFILDKNYKHGKDFIYICKHIIDNINDDTNVKKAINAKKSALLTPTSIIVYPRSFERSDYSYFMDYGLSSDIVYSSYIPVNRYSVNEYLNIYRHSVLDPCYAYINNYNCIKLVFPFRSKKQTRFISNNKIPIELLHTVRPCNYTILIKAYKDKLLMDYVCKRLNITDVQFIPVAAESARLDETIIDFLNINTLKRKFTLFDRDKCGYESSEYYRDNYGFDNIFMGEEYNQKDPTDLSKTAGIEIVINNFKNIYECF